jgi:hypothetical protein
VIRHRGPDLDQLLTQGFQVPSADRPRQRQLQQGVRQGLDRGERLQRCLVVIEPAAGQLRPLHCIHTLLDSLHRHPLRL